MAIILQIGKHHWLAGMHWVTYENALEKNVLRDDAERLAHRKNGAFVPDCIAARTGNACIQGGFAQIGDEEKPPKKLYSLAAILADTQRQPWLGIFKLGEDLFWLIAVRDGNGILPDGDVIGTQTEIEEIRNRYTRLNKDWEYVEGTFEFLENMLENIDKKPTSVRLLSIGGFPWKRACILSLLVCFVSASIWQVHRIKEAKIKSIREETRRKINKNQESLPIAPTHAQLLAAIPKPSVWLLACKDAVYGLPLTQNGWGLSTLNCMQKEASVVWKREDGATVEMRPEGLLDELGDTVTQIIPLIFPPPSYEEHLVPIQQAVIALRTWSQKIYISIKIESPNVHFGSAIPGAVAHQVELNHKSERVVHFDIMSPFSFTDEFDAIPGFRITSIKQNSNSSSQVGWHLQGALYGR